MLLPPLFQRAKKLVLGPEYDLSFALISRRQAHFLNQRYRRKNYPADVLSFPLAANAGEILISRGIRPLQQRLSLFIHGLLHLKGFSHGSKMKRKEQTLIASLTAHHGKNSRRRTGHRHRGHPHHRRRNVSGK